MCDLLAKGLEERRRNRVGGEDPAGGADGRADTLEHHMAIGFLDHFRCSKT